jgi:hypothetical protein
MSGQDSLIGKKAHVTADCDPYYAVSHVCIVCAFDGADYWGDFNSQGNDYVNGDGRWCIGKYPAEFELIETVTP